MIRIRSLVVVAILAAGSINAQNAAVHAPNLPGELESREAKPPVAPAPAKPPAAPAPAPGTPAKPPAAPAPAPGTLAKPPAAPAPAPGTPAKPPAAPAPAPGTPAKPPSGPALTPAKPVVAPAPAAPKPPVAAPAPSTKPGATLSPKATWVSNLVVKNDEAACWRKTSLAHEKKCAAGYTYDEVFSCWSECPIEFPVQCGMECIRQNKDCKLHSAKHAVDVATAAVSAATSGIFGALSKAVTKGVSCAQQIFDVSIRIYEALDDASTVAQGTTREKLADLIKETDLFAYDLPLAVASCISTDVAKAFSKDAGFIKTVDTVLLKIVETKITKQDIKDKLKYLDWFKKWFTKEGKDEKTDDVAVLTELTKTDIEQLAKSGDKCGLTLKKYLKKVEDKVKEMIKSKQAISIEYLQYVILNSDLVVKDLPAAVSSCLAEDTEKNRNEEDNIIAATQLIVDQILNAAFDKGVLSQISEYKLTIARMALTGLEFLFPVGIANLIKSLVQPICPLTQFYADIADGGAKEALGLTTVQLAFHGSDGMWNAVGDKNLNITFVSKDEYNVKVNVYSGGKRVARVKVKKGETVKWVQPLAEFAGKTLYLDRTRPGLFSLPGTGGGSLLMWVPKQEEGGVKLVVPINPTSFFDKEPKRELNDPEDTKSVKPK